MDDHEPHQCSGRSLRLNSAQLKAVERGQAITTRGGLRVDETDVIRFDEAKEWRALPVALPAQRQKRAPRIRRPRTRESRPRRSAARRASGVRTGQDPGEEPHEPGPARACLSCGRDISHRRADAKTCGATCRQQVKRHGPLPGEDPLPAVLCRGAGHVQVIDLRDDEPTCALCGHSVELDALALAA